MKIDLIDGGQLDTDKMPDSKALALEKTKFFSKDLDGLVKGYIIFEVNHDNTSFGSFNVKNKEDFDSLLDAFSFFLYNGSNGYCGIFKASKNGEYGFLLPKPKDVDNKQEKS